jgi:hypothetical protein
MGLFSGRLQKPSISRITLRYRTSTRHTYPRSKKGRSTHPDNPILDKPPPINIHNGLLTGTVMESADGFPVVSDLIRNPEIPPTPRISWMSLARRHRPKTGTTTGTEQ